MKRIFVFPISLLLIGGLLVGCSSSTVALSTCSQSHSRAYIWQWSMSKIGELPDSWGCFDPYEKPSAEFSSVRAFYQASKKGIASCDVKELQDLIINYFKDDHRAHLSNENNLYMPALDTIREIIVDGNSVVDRVEWYGCSDYAMFCEADMEGKKIDFIVHHSGEKNDSFDHYYVNDIDSWTRDEDHQGDYVTYSKEITKEGSESYYKGEIVFWICNNGDYSYQVVEKAMTENGQLIQRQSCVEILYDFNYYYVYFGNQSKVAPTITPEIVKSFTLKSFE